MTCGAKLIGRRSFLGHLVRILRVGYACERRQDDNRSAETFQHELLRIRAERAPPARVAHYLTEPMLAPTVSTEMQSILVGAGRAKWRGSTVSILASTRTRRGR